MAIFVLHFHLDCCLQNCLLFLVDWWKPKISSLKNDCSYAQVYGICTKVKKVYYCKQGSCAFVSLKALVFNICYTLNESVSIKFCSNWLWLLLEKSNNVPTLGLFVRFLLIHSLAWKCFNSTTETQQSIVSLKKVWNMFKVNNKDFTVMPVDCCVMFHVTYVVLMSLLLTLNMLLNCL